MRPADGLPAGGNGAVGLKVNRFFVQHCGERCKFFRRRDRHWNRILISQVEDYPSFFGLWVPVQSVVNNLSPVHDLGPTPSQRTGQVQAI